MSVNRFNPIIGVLAIGLLFSGCGKSEPDTPTPTPGPSTVAVTGVTVGSASLSLTEGGTGTISYTISPSNATNQGVSFKSSDPSVASVDGTGKVTAGKPGTASITVTTSDGGKTATCTVTVTAKTVAVTGVKLDKTTLELAVGASQKLTASVEPSNATNKEVTWKSSDDKVATVGTDGTVTGVKAGTVTISVTTKDGSKTATCKVTVTAKTVAVTGVTLNKSTVSIVIGETFKLVPTVKPDDATNKEVTWKSSNTAVATVAEDGTITAVKAGTATITCTTKDGAKKAT
ncbi:MAG: Ig domain-containing protein, partial [Bacteroidales bacterium]|nr:Ig domain-containing protein [Bacteroidales bacterium]